MYTLNLSTGVVTRDADGVVVAPAQSVSDAGFLEYLAWVQAGNQPAVTTSPESESRVVTKLAFRRRFTLAERIALDSAPDSAALDAQIRATLKTMAKDFELAEEINLDDADVIAGVTLLEQIGVIAAGRAAEVLAGI